MNDTVIFLILAGLAIIFKWLNSERSGDTQKPDPPSPNKPIPRAVPESEEERVRRFLEALGVPSGSQPSTPVRPRTVTPRPVVKSASPPQSPKVKRSWAQPLPPLVTTPEDGPLPPLPPLIRTPRAAPVSIVEAPAATPPPVPAELTRSLAPLPSAAKAKPLSPLSTSSLGPILGSREKVRQAIILREILGPPRGLQPFGQLPSQ